MIRPSASQSIRHAIHAAVHKGGNIKGLASDLDLAPSQLSMMATIGTEGEHRHFPAERIADLVHYTNDLGPLRAIAASCGYDLVPCSERVAEQEALLLTATIELVAALRRETR